MRRLLFVLLTAGALTFPVVTSYDTGAAAQCRSCDLDLSKYRGPLQRGEIDGLLLALDDEYRARAEYDQVVKDFGPVRPFVNIREAEANHIAALARLFAAYRLPLPENRWVGDVPRHASIPEACAAGVKGETENVELYRSLFATTSRPDILAVYRNLQQASQTRHLPAFRRCGGGGRRQRWRG